MRMFSSIVRAGLLAAAFGVAQVSATQSLRLSVIGETSFVDIDNLKLVAKITNTGDETLKVLHDPLSALSTLPANTFTVTHMSGALAQFTGIKAKYSPTAAITAGSFTVILPGAIVTVEHDFSQAYDLSKTGAGIYTIVPNKRFLIVDDNNDVSTILATTQSHIAKVTGRLTASSQNVLTKRENYIGCDDSQQTSAGIAGSSANAYAFTAWNYVNSVAVPTPRFEAWFGEWDSGHRTTVLSHLTLMKMTNFFSFTYDCTCTDPGTFAYVFPDQFGTIFLCGAFWNIAPMGTDSSGGAVLHVTSLFTTNGGTDENAYGQSQSMALASSDPAAAIMNADAYEYFAENTPFLV